LGFCRRKFWLITASTVDDLFLRRNSEDNKCADFSESSDTDFFVSMRTVKKEIIMPEFGSPFSGLKHDSKITNEELVRAIRFSVAAEYEAIQLYMQLAESTDNRLAREVLQDIADEERVHAGEFLRLLNEIAPDEKIFYDKGSKEVEEIIEKIT
jgi:hypothetical protein